MVYTWTDLKETSQTWKTLLNPSNEEKPAPKTRSYPPFWERAVPVVVAMIGIAIAALLIIALLVALGLFPGAL